MPFPLPGDFPNPGIEPVFPALAGGFFTAEAPGDPHLTPQKIIKRTLQQPCEGVVPDELGIKKD